MLIGIDLQNHGKSDHRDVPETFEQDAKDIITVLDKLNIEKASFFGFSNGATSIMKIAELFPDRVEKIIAASGVYKRKDAVGSELLRHFPDVRTASAGSLPHSRSFVLDCS